MPGMSAQQTIEQLRFIRPNLPILLSSGYDEGGVLPKFNNRRLFGFLHKPYTPVQLSEKVKAGIAEAASAASGGTVEAVHGHATPDIPANGFRVN
jgi:CheY-like chemotaxis protein